MARDSDERFITIKDGEGNVIYSGKDNRREHYPALQKKPFWHFTAADTLKIVGLLFLIVKFYFGTKYDLRDLQAQDLFFKNAFADQKEVNQQIFDYMRGHDIYLTQITGKRFKGGLPVDPSYDGGKRIDTIA